MVTQQILVLFFLVRIQVAQLFSTIIILFIGLWCNGNTTDSGPVFLGSNPGSPTEKIAQAIFFCLHSLLGSYI